MSLRSLTFALLATASAATYGAGAAMQLLDAQVDLEDKPSLQRGAAVFANYCLGCHSLNFMRYSRVGEDLEIPPEVLRDNLLFTADKPGEPMSVPVPKDLSKNWFGVTPPDLSLTARSRGPDWIYSYLVTYYLDENPARPFGVNNVVFPATAMPHVLWHLQGTQRYAPAEVEGTVVSSHVERLEAFSEGILVHKAVEIALPNGKHETHHVTDRLVLVEPGPLDPGVFRSEMRDLTNFLTYVSEPGKLQRTSIGVWVLVFLAFFIALTRMLYKEYWKDVH